jgi:hypothetical protein
LSARCPVPPAGPLIPNELPMACADPSARVRAAPACRPRTVENHLPPTQEFG